MFLLYLIKDNWGNQRLVPYYQLKVHTPTIKTRWKKTQDTKRNPTRQNYTNTIIPIKMWRKGMGKKSCKRRMKHTFSQVGINNIHISSSFIKTTSDHNTNPNIYFFPSVQHNYRSSVTCHNFRHREYYTS